MSTEHQDSIYQAENARVAGKLNEALWRIQNAGIIDPTTIPDLSDSQLSDRIRQWRILTVTGMSIVQGQWLAPHARDALLAVRPIFVRYYNNLEVFGRASTFLQDNEGHPYDHLAEMLRDRGKYYLVAYHISGNLPFLDRSIESFERTAFSIARLDSPKGIAMIETAQALRLKSQRPDQKTFRQITSRVYRGYITRGYRIAKDAVLESGDMDRLAWLLTTFVGEIKSNVLIDSDTKLTLIEAENEIDRLFGEKAAGIKRGYQRKMLVARFHRLMWRLTRGGLDFSQISLD